MICPHCKLEDRGGLHSADYCIERLGEILERLPVTGGMILPRPDVDPDAYRAGLCCDCSEAPISAGRPRCTPCHEALQSEQPTMAPQLERGKLGPCALPGCGKPTVPGCVICGPCRRARKGSADA